MIKVVNLLKYGINSCIHIWIKIPNSEKADSEGTKYTRRCHKCTREEIVLEYN